MADILVCLKIHMFVNEYKNDIISYKSSVLVKVI